ncbi:MAG: B12-binding domain-containing radical SAM protein [Candidatus Scalindua sp.]|nr:B12-binding domain-containing radical SAM protein [Candidatus Scalindua sp.]
MNILFINPPFMGRFSRSSRSPAVTKGGTLYYPIWLAYAAGVLEQAGHDIRLFDAPADDLDLGDIIDHLDGFIPEMVVVDTSTPSIYHDIQAAENIKQNFSSAFMVVVGTHPSSLPEETLSLSDRIDAIAVGEYEYTLRELASVLEGDRVLDTVKGLVFRKGDEIVRNGEREKIEDLDTLPFVSSVYKRHLHYRNYFFAAANYPMVMIITGRGCPFKCFFCVYPQVFHGRRYRTRSAENVVDEFEYIVGNFPGIEEIGIEDDCFTANRGHAREICELLIKRGIKIKWYCNVRGDVDYDLLKLMKLAGCRLVTAGFESGSQHVLDNMHKGEKVERYYQFAKETRRAGLLVHGCIMVGNPGDTRETVAESYEFAKKMNCDSMQFYPLYVYPGTEAFDWAQHNGYLQTNDFSRWLTKDGLHNCVLSTPELSSEEMVSLCDYYLKKYHLRPGYLLSKFRQAIIHPSEGYRTYKSAKVFFSRILNGQLAGSN